MTRDAAREEGAELDSKLDSLPSATKFEERFGRDLVAQGISTFPAVLLRWQGALGLTDEDLVTALNLLTFYIRKAWPSVSIQALAAWRKVGRRRIESSIRRLEKMGYVRKGQKLDPRFGTYFYDLSGLLGRLERCAVAEREMKALDRKKAALRDSLSTSPLREGCEQLEDVTEDSNKQKDFEEEERKEVGLSRPYIGMVSVSEPASRIH